MVTFSSGSTVANQLPGLINIVQVLPDNTAKVITPKNFRDSVFTLWENSIFKPTSVSTSNIYYIGVDQYQIVDSGGVSIYPEVFFGKKQIGGSFIMNNDTLQQSEVDFFFYNMRDNSSGNYDTAIAILAGSQSVMMPSGDVGAPILKSTVVSSANGNYLNFNILNKSYVSDGVTEYGGDINLLSNKGVVSLNGFSFPKASEHTGVLGAAKEGYVLKYRWVNNQAIGSWESAFSQSITTINQPSSQVTITGDPIVLNGYRFTDSNTTATGIGGIKAGESFNNVDVLDMIRRIVYTYIPTVISSSFTLGGTPITLIEVGDNANMGKIRLDYKITVNATHSIQTFSILPPYQNVSATPNVNLITRGETTWNVTLGQDIILPNTETYRVLNYTFSITDNYPTNATFSNKLTVVLPYFYGAISTFSSDTSFLKPGTSFNTGLNNYLGTNSLAPVNKLKSILVQPIINTATYSNNLRLNITTQGLGTGDGQGWIYFGLPSSFPPIKSIKDSNGLQVFNVNNASTYPIATYSVNISYGGIPKLWQARDYTFYITKNRTTYGFNPVPWDFMFVTQSGG